MPKEKMIRTRNCTRVKFQALEIPTKRTVEKTVILPKWLKNETYITHAIEDLLKYNTSIEYKVYYIDSIELVKVIYTLSLKQFYELATRSDDCVVIKKLK